jgi:Na+/H+-dicarboxylate symporter
MVRRLSGQLYAQVLIGIAIGILAGPVAPAFPRLIPLAPAEAEA